MKRARIAVKAYFLILLGIFLSGCGDNFFDPTQIGRFRPVPAVNVILDSLGVAEEEPSAFEGAEEPRPIDIIAYETDYVFGSGDIVRVSIFELLQQGTVFVNDYVVTESGNISIPEVGVIGAEGLTEPQLEEQLREILVVSGILKEPSVTVTLLRSQQRTFAISGNGVPRPNRYEIPRYDFRLAEALATAGGISQFNISYVYVTRRVTGEEQIYQTDENPANEDETKDAEPAFGLGDEALEVLIPRAQRLVPGDKLVIAAAELASDEELAQIALPEECVLPEESGDSEIDLGQLLESLEKEAADAEAESAQEDTLIEEDQSQVDLDELLEALEATEAEDIAEAQAIRETVDELIDDEEAGRIEWVFEDGKWVPVRVGEPEITEVVPEPERVFEGLREQRAEDFDWDEIGRGGIQTRLIKIPTDKIRGGDPRYNIVIRAGDSIEVPVDIIGEFYIGGNTNYQGYIDMTGRPMTLKMAITAAGGLGPLAWPKRCEVTRRIGKHQEETVMVDLDKIARGEQPDFFIKPNDLINVGTHPTSRWRAVLRNAFRATYGFGFIYDRNFADRDYGTRRPIPDWF